MRDVDDYLAGLPGGAERTELVVRRLLDVRMRLIDAAPAIG